MQPSPLVLYTLAGLTKCYMEEQGLWSFRYHLDGRAHANESRPAYDVFYSLNVLLALAKVSSVAKGVSGFDASVMYAPIAMRLSKVTARRCAYGTALWAAAELGVQVPSSIIERAREMVPRGTVLEMWRAQDIGMMLSGLTAQARDNASWRQSARSARNLVLTKFVTRSGLFRDCATGPRRRFGSFASQVYCCLALYQFADLFGDDEAAAAADRCVAVLIGLQGPQGEWPWFYDVISGRVVDYYEVYSVHQHGMAPAILKRAMRSNLPGAREALIKGFNWITGANRLAVSMLDGHLPLIARSQARSGPAAGRFWRIARASVEHVAGRPARVDLPAHRLLIRKEVRSYEMAWTLWSFGDDTDFPELTHSSAFKMCKAKQQQAGLAA